MAVSANFIPDSVLTAKSCFLKHLKQICACRKLLENLRFNVHSNVEQESKKETLRHTWKPVLRSSMNVQNAASNLKKIFSNSIFQESIKMLFSKSLIRRLKVKLLSSKIRIINMEELNNNLHKDISIQFQEELSQLVGKDSIWIHLFNGLANKKECRIIKITSKIIKIMAIIIITNSSKIYSILTFWNYVFLIKCIISPDLGSTAPNSP